MNQFALTSALVVQLFCFQTTFAADRDYVLPVAPNELKIMSYNVENLFDAEHDAGKNDYEFLPKSDPEKSHCYDKADKGSSPAFLTATQFLTLPLTAAKNYCAELDWTAEKVLMKYKQIQEVMAAQGPLPDILTIVEVENPHVVGELARGLGFDGFKMTNSPDARGIDVAVLYREDKLQVVEYAEKVVPGSLYPTRNISYIVFRLSDAVGGGLLALFPNHWPSQGNPTKARTIVAEALRDLIDEVSDKYSDEELNIVIDGDFNTIDEDSPNPIDTVILDSKWSGGFKDVRHLSKLARNPMIPKMPQATYYYGVDNAWNELDRFFINAPLHDRSGLNVDLQSYRIHAPTFLTKKNKDGEAVPFRYNHNSTEKKFLGYSDHFGVVMKLRYE